MPRVYGYMGPADEEQSTKATHPSTPTTQASNKAACDSILQRFDKKFFSSLREKCTTEKNGNVKLTSEPQGKPTLKIEMLTSNKDKSPIWWTGYESGYAIGVSAAREGRPFIIIRSSSTASEFGAGFDYGYPQGYQMYKSMHPAFGK